ncbi:MAG: integrase core domain-containing protein [Polyangiaceae bacterium]
MITTFPPRAPRDREPALSDECFQRAAGIRQNSLCERFIGSVRRECLDHVIVLGEAHLQRILEEYALRYFNAARPHHGIAQQIPVQAKRCSFAGSATVVAFPILGGLHHDYVVAA